MKSEKFLIGKLPCIVYGEPAGQVYLYLHGQGGNKEEAAAFAELADKKHFQVLAFDLPGHGERKDEFGRFVPWEIVPEIKQADAYMKTRWRTRFLYAVSIGAYFGMLALFEQPFSGCLFVSPILNMKRLIENMMKWSGVTDERLKREGVIPTSFGTDLSWDYLQYAAARPIVKWDIPTAIYYGDGDHLTEIEVAQAFAGRFRAKLTVVEGGEHYVHTPCQVQALNAWLIRQLS